LDAVILFSHGSILCGSGVALLEHAARLRDSCGIEIVEVGYLNYSDPPFAAAVKTCIERGATRIFVLPYFLVPGKFVTSDLPRAIDEVKSRHKCVEFVVAEAIGYDEALADAIMDSAANALPEERWRDEMKNASLHCLENSICPLYDTTSCPGRRIDAGVPT
jgi:sirohydrochlorin cobaltochelatase